ncbi:D-glucuronyl C5-epimerase family protein [Streptomyces sp. NPDC050504]|uniref:D-glucuronyl C5-epimerase family protein n=1 Tax=Streptomyces sp. NPDC050504 TaxID=3365618 RepID=UPI0037B9A2E0
MDGNIGRRKAFRWAGGAVAALGAVGAGIGAAALRGTASPGGGQPAVPPSSRRSVAGLPVGFRTDGYRCSTDVPDALQPWRGRRAKRADTDPHDASGVRMFSRDGKLHDHPVGQIQYGLHNLAAFRASGDRFFLDRCVAQAERLIARRVERRGAWYFPYSFDFRLDAHDGIEFRGPWFSGMAQGESLSLFGQLAKIDALPGRQRARYGAAARAAFTSLLRGNDAKPWVVARDEKGLLWLHEYPIDAPGTSDCTYNGHMFAALGLWDHHHLTGDPLAERLFDGALSTLSAEFETLRGKEWLSHYCRTHLVPTASYHQVHVTLLSQLGHLGGGAGFARLSDALMDDYPTPSLGMSGGRVVFAPGRHATYDFDDEGGVRSASELVVAAAEEHSASRRTRIKGRGIHYLLTSGPGKGRYVEESFPRVWLRGTWCKSGYREGRTALFPAGVSVVCRSEDGRTQRAVSHERDTKVPFDARAVVDGRVMVRLGTGLWAPVAQLALDAA